jgi:two-component system, sensor histidine kinase LadS
MRFMLWRANLHTRCAYQGAKKPYAANLPNLLYAFFPQPYVRRSLMLSSFQHAATWLLLCMLCIGSACAQGSERGQGGLPVDALVLRDEQPRVPVERGVEYLIDSSAAGDLTRTDVTDTHNANLWQPYLGKRINLSREIRPVWFRFSVNNQGPGLVTRLLNVDWPLLEDIQLHVFDVASQQWQVPVHGGAAWGDEAQALKDPAHVFALKVEVGQAAVVMLRVRTGSTFFAPLELWVPAQFQAQRYDRGMLMGVLFGILSIMLLYNASLALFTRERSYLWYSIYLSTVLLYELAVTGYGGLYLWGNAPWLVSRGYDTFACLCFLTATVFFRKFLELHQGPRHILFMNTTMVTFWVITLVLSISWPSNLLWNSVNLVGMLSGFIGVYGSVYLVVLGNISARYFLLAWTVLIVSTFMTLMSLLGMVEGNALIDNAQHIGFVIETLLLSVALADRIRRDRLYREAAQSHTLALTESVRQEREQKIIAQEQALAAQQRANELLERRVHDRTGELERAMSNLEMANIELAKLSVTDALTKTHNRRHFDDVFAKEHERSARMGTPLALLLADIDHFKAINDNFGHLAGDECLRLVATTLQQVVGRSNDMVARYGGEEFALVLPGTPADQALEVAERVRLAVEGISFIYRGARVPIRVSLGVVAQVASTAQSVSEFISRADAALYQAKGQGRNRAVLAPDA